MVSDLLFHILIDGNCFIILKENILNIIYLHKKKIHPECFFLFFLFFLFCLLEGYPIRGVCVRVEESAPEPRGG